MDKKNDVEGGVKFEVNTYGAVAYVSITGDVAKALTVEGEAQRATTQEGKSRATSDSPRR